MSAGSLVSAHGSMKFDHDGYRQRAEHGTMVLTSFESSDMEVVFPNDSAPSALTRP